MSADLSIVTPVCNGGECIHRLLDEISLKIGSLVKEVVLVYDSQQDATLLSVRRAECRCAFPVRLVQNAGKRGMLDAVRTGFEQAEGPLVLVCTPDSSDDLVVVPQMVQRIRRGADVVCGSRYVRGGCQNGGSLLRRAVSRLAGVSLHWLTGIPTRDAASDFKLYHKTLLDRLTIESADGCEVGMEVVVKTFAMGGRIDEVAIVRDERSVETPRVRLQKQWSGYFRWYWYAVKNRFAPACLVDETLPGMQVLPISKTLQHSQASVTPPTRRRLAG